MYKNYFDLSHLDSVSAQVRSLRTSLRQKGYLAEQIFAMEADLDSFKSKSDLPDELIMRFHEDKLREDYQTVFEKPNPLVTICIGTYNRAELLIKRAIPSILGQTYKNIQLIVVGDCCTDDTEKQVAKIKDSRLQFINLKERGKYPDESMLRWMVAGTQSINTALLMAEGNFISHLDDDDRHALHRIEVLLDYSRRNRIDLVWHPFWIEGHDYRWHLNSSPAFRKGSVSTSSIFYHSWFKRIPWDLNAYKYREPGDWNRLRKIRHIGASSGRYNEILLQHFRERNQTK